MDRLNSSDREEIEKRVIRHCLLGESRFFSALDSIRLFHLETEFNGQALKNMDTEARAELFRILYLKTHKTICLFNLIQLVPGSASAFRCIARLFRETNWGEEVLEEEEYIRIFRALKSIVEVRGPDRHNNVNMIEKHFGKCAYLKMKMLDLEEVEKIKDIGEWSYSGCDKALAFWNAYEWRLLFLKTEEYGYIKEIVRESINKSWILLHQNILIPYFSACNISCR